MKNKLYSEAEVEKAADSKFHVSEWGGVIDTGKDQMFVCNQ